MIRFALALAAYCSVIASQPATRSLCPDFRLIKTVAPAKSYITQTLSNPDKSRTALVACLPIKKAPDRCQDHLFIQAQQTTYELKTRCFLPWRPFTALAWKDIHILTFDQWANPHFGQYYVMNLKRRSLWRSEKFETGSEPP